MIALRIVSDPYENKIAYFRGNPVTKQWEPVNNSNSGLMNEKFISGVFTFNVASIVDTIFEEFYVGKERISITFEGTADEFDELEAICRDEKYRGKITAVPSRRYLKNARDILPKVKRIFDKMQPIINESVHDDEKIRRERTRFADASKEAIPLCVMGNYSSGKSTFINALIGYEILPSGADPLTAKIHRIERSYEKDRATVSFGYNGSFVEIKLGESGIPEINLPENDELRLQIVNVLKEHDNQPVTFRVYKLLELVNNGAAPQVIEKLSSMISVIVPFNDEGVFGQSLNHYVIFDTPGSNSATNTDHFAVLKKQMEEMSNGLPIYVSEYDKLDSTDNEKLCAEIKAMRELDSRYTLIVVNKADSSKVKKNYDPDRLLHQVVPRHLYSNGIFFVSSIMGLGSKNDGHFFNADYEETYELMSEVFSNPESKFYKKLYEYDLSATQLKRQSVERSEACANRVYANSGLYWIEVEIENFASKYSAYNKCQQSRLFLDKVVAITNQDIEETTAQCAERKQGMEQQLEEGKSRLIEELGSDRDSLTMLYFNNYEGAMQKYIKQAKVKMLREELEKQAKEFEYSIRSSPDLQLSEEYKDKADIVGGLRSRDIGAVRNGIKTNISRSKEQRDIRKELNSRVSDELLKAVKDTFTSKVDKALQMINAGSVSFWTVRTEDMKKRLAERVMGSDALTSDKKSEIEQIIMTYEAISFGNQADSIFSKAEFERRAFSIFGIKLIEENTLNLAKLAKRYNNELLAAVDNIYAGVKYNHDNAFREWSKMLLELIRGNIIEYNPELNQLAKNIAEDEQHIRLLESRKKQINEYAQQIADKMSWKMQDIDGNPDDDDDDDNENT